MITEFEHNLASILKKKVLLDTECQSTAKRFCKSGYDTGDREVTDRIGYPVESDSDVIPCMNVDCRWVEYLELFYSSLDFWLLPAVTEEDHCVICEMINGGECRRSDLRINTDKCVLVGGEVVIRKTKIYK